MEYLPKTIPEYKNGPAIPRINQKIGCFLVNYMNMVSQNVLKMAYASLWHPPVPFYCKITHSNFFDKFDPEHTFIVPITSVQNKWVTKKTFAPQARCKSKALRATYLADRVIVYEGTPSVSAKANTCALQIPQPACPPGFQTDETTPFFCKWVR